MDSAEIMKVIYAAWFPWIFLLILLFIAPLAIWIHCARTAKAVRQHTAILRSIAAALGASVEDLKEKKLPDLGLAPGQNLWAEGNDRRSRRKETPE